MWEPVQEVERFFRLPLTETEREQVLYRNAETLYGLGESMNG